MFAHCLLGCESQVYMDPLRRHQGAVVERDNIDDIFYQIPQLADLHQEFIKDLSKKNEQWNELETIGDLFMMHVSYSTFRDSLPLPRSLSLHAVHQGCTL